MDHLVNKSDDVPSIQQFSAMLVCGLLNGRGGANKKRRMQGGQARLAHAVTFELCKVSEGKALKLCPPYISDENGGTKKAPGGPGASETICVEPDASKAMRRKNKAPFVRFKAMP